MDFYLGKESFRNYREAIRREWVITNGLGGYAGSSIVLANTRKHHGLFIPSFHAPTKRMVLVNGLYEKLIFSNKEIDLYSGKKKGKSPSEGFLYQTAFSNNKVPCFYYEVQGVSMKKTIAYECQRNTVAVLYEINNEGEDFVLSLKPSINFRDHNDGSKKRDLKFSFEINKSEITFIPQKDKSVRLKMYASEGKLNKVDDRECFDKDIELQTEIDTGMSSADTAYCPVTVDIGIKSGESRKISVVFSIEEEYEKNAEKTVNAYIERQKELINQAGTRDEFINSLVLAADRFICRRESTNGKTILAGLPWFTDWGRDTMISLTGLTLVTRRFEDARSILETFVAYEKNGLLPNMFPDENLKPLYNTADASLWFFYCVHKFLEYENNEEAYCFVKDKLYPTMKRIIKAYSEGTDFSIKMDEDGLIMAGSDLDQVTWMDVRVGDRVMTPRHGKPVEINALWYNGLKEMAALADKYKDGDLSSHYEKMAERTRVSFAEKFWNEENGCLYDVVDELREGGLLGNDSRIRPNQIYAVSLPHSILSPAKEKSIVSVVRRRLVTDYGLRTLDSEDPDYHGLYKGELSKRDEAYHQGTAWAYLMGGFITAYLKVNGNSNEAKENAAALLRPLKHHLFDGCIGGIAEVFDGDSPHISGGCYTQAWSVGEILRAVYEGGLTV